MEPVTTRQVWRRAGVGLVAATAAAGLGAGAALGGVVTDTAPPARISVEKSGPATIAPGGLISYEIKVTNTSPGRIPLFRVQVADPNAATLAEPANHDIMPGAGMSTVYKLRPGEAAIWRATRVAPTGPGACGQVLENSAQAWLAGNNQNRPGVVPSPRNAVVTSNVVRTTVVCPVPTGPVVTPAALASLSATKTGPATARRGAAITYRLTLRNTSAQTATDVMVRDRITVGYALARRPQGATLEGGVLVWRLGNLAPGQTVQATVRLRINGRPGQTRCNTVTLMASNAATAEGRACTRIVGPKPPPVPVTG